MSQFVLACGGFAALLIIFVHPLFYPPVSTPVKGQFVLLFLAIVTAWLTLSLARRELVARHAAEAESAFAPPEDERLALICTLLC